MQDNGVGGRDDLEAEAFGNIASLSHRAQEEVKDVLRSFPPILVEVEPASGEDRPISRLPVVDSCSHVASSMGFSAVAQCLCTTYRQA